jgi:hypothetical protein
MAARFIRDSKVGTGAAPFQPVRRDAAAASARLREEMGQLMAQRAIDLRGAVIGQPTVERYKRGTIFGTTGGGAEPF